jgi:hypothetical protein
MYSFLYAELADAALMRISQPIRRAAPNICRNGYVPPVGTIDDASAPRGAR